MKSAFFVNNDIKRRFQMANCYLFCASHHLGASAKGTYNSCVLIHDYAVAMKAIRIGMTRHLDALFSQQSGYVRYQPVERQDLGEPPDEVAFVKETIPFQCEREVRTVWWNANGLPTDAQHIDLIVPDLIPLVELVSIPADR